MLQKVEDMKFLILMENQGNAIGGGGGGITLKYSHHSIMECYNLFSGVELSMRSFCVISVSGMGFSAGGSVVPEVT